MGCVDEGIYRLADSGFCGMDSVLDLFRCLGDMAGVPVRKYARLDANQSEIVGFLRAIPGFSVLSLATIGNGCPDILVGYKGRNGLFELKDPDKPASKRILTPDQETFHAAWNGQIDVAETFGEILNVMRNRK